MAKRRIIVKSTTSLTLMLLIYQSFHHKKLQYKSKTDEKKIVHASIVK